MRGAFYSNINTTKRDVQMSEADSEWKNENVGGRLAVNGRYQGDRTFITSVDYKLSAQMNRQYDWKSDWVSNPDGVITNTREEGLQPARFKRTGHHSEYTIESIPLNIYGQIVANKYMQFGEKDYTNVKFGAEYTYDGNKGDGLSYVIEKAIVSNATKIANDVAACLNDTVSAKERRLSLRATRNIAVHHLVPQLLDYVQTKADEEMQLLIIEALGWHPLTCQRQLIGDAMLAINKDARYSEDVRNEALKTYNRLYAK